MEILHPSLQRLKRIAVALGALSEDVVFIGGAIAPILQVTPPFGESRPTSDADGVFASTSYSEANVLAEAMRKRSFRQDLQDNRHLHRWLSPDGDKLDLVPSGAHLGASGQPWDVIAIRTSATCDLGDSVQIRHASAPAWLALKWAAFKDRGSSDPFSSDDLEDILALVASRPAIVAELASSEPVIRQFVGATFRDLLDDNRLEDLLAGHLNNAQDSAETTTVVRARLEAISNLTLP